MPSMGSSLVAVALFLCANRGTGKQSFNADAFGDAFLHLCNARQCRGSARKRSCGLGLWSPSELKHFWSLLALKLQVAEAQVSGTFLEALNWWFLTWSHLKIWHKIGRSQFLSLSRSLFFLFSWIESYWQLLAMSQKEFALTFSLSMEE